MTRYTPKDEKMTSSTKDEIDEVSGAISYIKFSGDYDNFYEWKEKTKMISRYKVILKHLTKEV